MKHCKDLGVEIVANNIRNIPWNTKTKKTRICESDTCQIDVL